MRKIDNKFDTKLGVALATSPSPNIFQPIANAVSNVGILIDNQEKKENKRKEIKHNIFMDNSNMELKKISLFDGLLSSSQDRELKDKAEKRTNNDYMLRNKKIKEKINDNSKLAKFLTSGKDFKSFTKEHGDFSSPAITKTAMDFSNKNKTMINKQKYDTQFSILATDSRFINDGIFDAKKATDFMAKKIRRGEADPIFGASLIDGLHKASGYGIYAKPKSEIKQSYAPTEASKAYRENLASISDATKRSEWRKKHPFINFRKEYNEQKKMSSGVSSTNLINTTIKDFSNEYKIKDLANYDFYNGILKGDVPTSRIEEIKRIMANSKQAQVLDAQMSKKANELGIIRGQAINFGRYADSDNVDTNFLKSKVDEIKTYIPGLEYSDKEIENEEFRRDFLNITSTLLKLQSGLTVSDKELTRFEQSMGTLERNKNTNFIGVKKKLEDVRNGFLGIKAIDPQYFNIKYGDSIRGLSTSIELIDKAIRRKKKAIVDIKGRNGFHVKMNPFDVFGDMDD